MGCQTTNRQEIVVRKKEILSVNIQTFGGFDVTISDKSVMKYFGSSKKTLILFKFFVANIGEMLSANRIMEMNFGDIEYLDADNTLRGYIYRLRKILEKMNEMVGTRVLSVDYVTDSYLFSASKGCNIDFIEFQTLVNEFLNPKNDNDEESQINRHEDREQLIKRIKELYKGSFMGESDNIEWVRPMKFEMQKKFLRFMTTVLEQLYKEEEYDKALIEADEVSSQLFFEEDFQEIYLKILKAQNKPQKLADYYQFMIERYNKERGIAPSEKLTEIMSSKTESIENTELTGFFSIEKYIHKLEKDSQDGIFIVSKPFFVDLYRLELRRKRRNGERLTAVGIIDIITSDYRDLSKGEAKDIKEKIINLVSSVTRAQDVLCVLNDHQIAFMLFDALERTVIDVNLRMSDGLEKIKKEDRLYISINFKTISAEGKYSKEHTI